MMNYDHNIPGKKETAPIQQMRTLTIVEKCEHLLRKYRRIGSNKCESQEKPEYMLPFICYFEVSRSLTGMLCKNDGECG